MSDWKQGKRLQDARAAALQQMRSLTRRLEMENRPRMTAGETAQFNKYEAEIERCNDGLVAYLAEQNEEKTMRIIQRGNTNPIDFPNGRDDELSPPSAGWIDRNSGERIEMLAP